jgi:ribosomal protein S18 acetylase RimI-like enzyme
MQTDFAGPLPIPAWPEGLSVSSFKPEDEQELYTLIYSVFDWPGRDPTPPPIELWRRHLFRGGRFDPDLFLILRQSEQMVGAALAYDETTNGWIRQLAVAKELQGKGYGSRLLRHVLGIFSQKGLPSAALGVEAENEHAVQFYERCGMCQSRDFLEYRKKM